MEVAPPPAGLSRQIDWRGVEGRIGTSLPADYKEMVQTYGPGAFGNFIYILQPDSNNHNIDLEHRGAMAIEALRVLQADRSGNPYGGGEELPYRLGGSPEIIPWAITDNGDVCYWVTRQSSGPDGWRVAVNEGSAPEWEEFDGSSTEFLLAVLSGDYVSDIFPDDFPGDDVGFVSMA